MLHSIPVITIPPPSVFGYIPPLVPIPDSDETNNFCPISLGDWLALCQQTGVPHVAATQVAIINRYDLLDQEKTPSRDRADTAVTDAQAAALANHMMRFDCCSGTEVKHRLSEGHPTWHPDFNTVNIGDPRIFDIVLEFPRERIPIWRRPWLNTRTIEDYPVEYRTYVYDGNLDGISNYYIQRPLPLIQKHIDQVTEYTNRLIEAAPTPFLWNDSPHLDYFAQRYDISGIHFTADFIVSEQDEVLFLEGGPPHHLGAHPCCFPVGQTQGIALSAHQPESS